MSQIKLGSAYLIRNVDFESSPKQKTAKMEPNTPFSPCSFDYYPGSPDPQVPECKSFRFAGAPDGPLPDIPSEEEESQRSESEGGQPEIIVRRRIPRFKDQPV